MARGREPSPSVPRTGWIAKTGCPRTSDSLVPMEQPTTSDPGRDRVRPLATRRSHVFTACLTLRLPRFFPTVLSSSILLPGEPIRLRKKGTDTFYQLKSWPNKTTHLNLIYPVPDLDVETHLIGDCLSPRSAEEAVYEGLIAAREV